MPIETDNLRSFIEKLRSISFWERLFGWKTVRNGLIDAAAALNSVLNRIDHLQSGTQELNNQLSDSRKDLNIAREEIIRQESTLDRYLEVIREKENQVAQLATELSAEKANHRNAEKQIQSLMTELATARERLSNTEQELRTTREENLTLKQEEEFRKDEHSRSVATLESIRKQVHDEREKEKEEKAAIEIERLQRLKDTWMNHQVQVKKSIQQICNKHNIEYVEAVPFRGEPDNTLMICEEYVVFDAKSPGSDDLTNFPHYIKDQAEKARKYARQEHVKGDIFFVVPSNTLELLKQNCYALGDYNVYVVSADSLEPLILCLKKIEDYEFAEQLSPEERENICRIIGKFAHLTKRRIQIDSFFARQFIEIAYKCETDLPKDILEKAAEFERSEKLNPPMEKRAKAINTKQLEDDTLKMETDAGNKGIVIENIMISGSLNGLPLYKDGF